MQSAIHRAAETPSQIRMREEAKLRRARMALKPAIVKIVPVVPDENAAPKKKTEIGFDYAGWFKRQEQINPLPIQDAAEVEAAAKLLAAAAAAYRTVTVTTSVRKIQQACAAFYKTTTTILLSHRRSADIVKPRMVAMYLAKCMTMESFPQIGRRFDNRDHTTVLHAVRKIETLLETDEALAADIAAIKAVLE